MEPLRIDPATGRIPVDFNDDYLQLVRLLQQGAGLEHSLMIAYLYALFSIKDDYKKVKGELSKRSYLEHAPTGRAGSRRILKDHDFLSICIEEMQHLSLVNRFLTELGSAPNFVPHVYPYSSDIYPIPIDLFPLDRYVAATYLWIEADDCALSLEPGCEGKGESKEFIHEVRGVLEEGAPSHGGPPIDKAKLSHVGSLYNTVAEYVEKVAANPPGFLPRPFPWAEWTTRTRWLIDQGEIAHYNFFRGLFTGEAFGGDGGIWDKCNLAYPSLDLVRGTAYKGHPSTFQDEDARRVAWLSDLHYWILLGFLDLAYRDFSRKARYRAIDNMTQGLWALGLGLANRFEVGIPFDQYGTVMSYGRDPNLTICVLTRLLGEADREMKALREEDLLPPGYDPELIAMSLDGLKCSPPEVKPYWVFQS